MIFIDPPYNTGNDYRSTRTSYEGQYGRIPGTDGADKGRRQDDRQPRDVRTVPFGLAYDDVPQAVVSSIIC